eukprot:6029675-Amphidinium_carterae.1
MLLNTRTEFSRMTVWRDVRAVGGCCVCVWARVFCVRVNFDILCCETLVHMVSQASLPKFKVVTSITQKTVLKYRARRKDYQ